MDFWDYSNLKFHLGGLVCLRFCLYWTVLALGLIYGADPLVIPLLARIPERLHTPAMTVLLTDGLVSAAALRLTGTTEVLQWYK